MRIRPFAAPPGLTWESVRADLDAWVREVRQVLNGGLRLRDQLGAVRDVAIDTAALPVVIEAPVRPLSVLLVRATVQIGSDGRVVSGGAVTWDAVPGGIRIHAIDGLAAATRYDVTLALVE